MSTDTYHHCLGCDKQFEESELVEYREDDVNWSELRCPECESTDLEKITDTEETK